MNTNNKFNFKINILGICMKVVIWSSVFKGLNLTKQLYFKINNNFVVYCMKGTISKCGKMYLNRYQKPNNGMKKLMPEKFLALTWLLEYKCIQYLLYIFKNKYQ